MHDETTLARRQGKSKPGTDVMILKNIFAENFCEKIGVFDSKQS
jgi:hypothetical protein